MCHKLVHPHNDHNLECWDVISHIHTFGQLADYIGHQYKISHDWRDNPHFCAGHSEHSPFSAGWQPWRYIRQAPGKSYALKFWCHWHPPLSLQPQYIWDHGTCDMKLMVETLLIVCWFTMKMKVNVLLREFQPLWASPSYSFYITCVVSLRWEWMWTYCHVESSHCELHYHIQLQKYLFSDGFYYKHGYNTWN